MVVRPSVARVSGAYFELLRKMMLKRKHLEMDDWRMSVKVRLMMVVFGRMILPRSWGRIWKGPSVQVCFGSLFQLLSSATLSQVLLHSLVLGPRVVDRSGCPRK